MNAAPLVSISIVSHGQGNLVRTLLQDCRTFQGINFEIIITFNIPEDKKFIHDFNDLPIKIIENSYAKGFGENHNQAFNLSRGDIFIVMNPDIRATCLNFENIVTLTLQNRVGACAPKVLGVSGNVEDSARRFPTIIILLIRFFCRFKKNDYDLSVPGPIAVDWVAGMFVAFQSSIFKSIGGFDKRYFMYMEDIDICKRLRDNNYEVLVDCSTTVIHDARRASRRNIKYFFWHMRSAVRFFIINKNFLV